MTAETSRTDLQPQESPQRTESGEPAGWHLARQRALCYLEHFELSAIQGLELVLTALQRARQIAGTAAPAADMHPVNLTMRQLHVLLAESGIWREDTPPYGAAFKYSALIRGVGGSAATLPDICSMPALGRRSMKPVKEKQKNRHRQSRSSVTAPSA